MTAPQSAHEAHLDRMIGVWIGRAHLLFPQDALTASCWLWEQIQHGADVDCRIALASVKQGLSPEGRRTYTEFVTRQNTPQTEAVERRLTAAARAQREAA